jgi:hypothetical protein
MAIVLLLIIACLVLAPVCVIAAMGQRRAHLIPVDLGWMSAHWLAEYRASHSD